MIGAGLSPHEVLSLTLHIGNRVPDATTLSQVFVPRLHHEPCDDLLGVRFVPGHLRHELVVMERERGAYRALRCFRIQAPSVRQASGHKLARE
jgi:hypothetical protein